MNKKYFVVEMDTKDDGTVNTSITARSTFSGALSLYHDRYSKMCVNDQFTKVALSLVDEELEVVQHDVIIPNTEP